MWMFKIWTEINILLLLLYQIKLVLLRTIVVIIHGTEEKNIYHNLNKLIITLCITNKILNKIEIRIILFYSHSGSHLVFVTKISKISYNAIYL